MGWTKKDIETLAKRAMIRGYKIEPVKNGAPKSSKRSEEKEWITLNLQKWCNNHSLELKTELKFDRKRKWRFDWAIPALNIAIEYEGIYAKKSRHTTIEGYTGDIHKYNRAIQLGWKLLRFTASNYQTLITEIENCIV